MSKNIVCIPFEDIGKLSIVFGNGKTMTQVKGDADYIMNAGFYDMDSGAPVGHLKVDGKVYAKASWNCWGLTWGDGRDLRMAVIPDCGGENYLSGVELLTPDKGTGAALSYLPEVGGARPRTAIGLTDDSVILYCSDKAVTPEQVRDELYDLGCRRALLLDSGGSTQCDFPDGRIYSARRVNNYLCLWQDSKVTFTPEKEETKTKTICLDPGHGPGTVNGSPDGSYKEREFTWDMYQRIRPLLEAQGINVVCTREEGEKPSLTERAQVSNRANADLFVSLHSNAAGSGWSTANGWMCYTSMAGDSAGRNVAAKAILARHKEAGVNIHGNGIAHELYTVLVKADAPAVLIEYGFHTNQGDVALLKDSSYRDKLAEATAKGICDYLGLAYEAEDKEEGDSEAPASWAAEAWEKAQKSGVMDGTRPQANITRQEVAVILDRLNLL